MCGSTGLERADTADGGRDIVERGFPAELDRSSVVLDVPHPALDAVMRPTPIHADTAVRGWRRTSSPSWAHAPLALSLRAHPGPPAAESTGRPRSAPVAPGRRVGRNGKRRRCVGGYTDRRSRCGGALCTVQARSCAGRVREHDMTNSLEPEVAREGWCETGKGVRTCFRVMARVLGAGGRAEARVVLDTRCDGEEVLGVLRRACPKARAYKKEQGFGGERAETSNVLARTLPLSSSRPLPLPIASVVAFAAAAVVDTACVFILPVTS